MIGPKHVKRKAQIAKILAKHGFGFLVDKIGLGRFVPFHWGILGHGRRREPYSAPEHLRLAFEELGATFIKLGQILSTRPDLVAEEYLEELSHLQDRIPPCPAEAVERVIEEELGKPYVLKNELDYVREGRNAETFRRNFLGDETVYIPKVYWEFTTSKVLVLEELQGVKLTDLEGIRRMGYDPRELARRGAYLYLNMFFRDGFFHGDPHPGNFFVLRDGRIGMVDFGMVGVLDDLKRVNLLQLIYGIAKNDMSLVMDALYDLGIRGDLKRENMLRKEFEVLFSYYFFQSLSEVKLSKVVNEIFRLTYRYRISLPSDLFLLLKTIGMAEGLLMSLDPQFRMINVAEPYVARMRRMLLSPRFMARRVERNAIILSKMFMESPEKVKRFLNMLEGGRVEFSIRYEGEKRFVSDLRKDINRLTISILTLAFILSMALVVSAYKPDFFRVEFFLAFVGGVALLFFGGLMMKVFREGT